MSSEIKFFGIKSSQGKANGSKILDIFKRDLPSKCPIKVPYAFIFNAEEAKDVKKENFPWPMSARIVQNEQINSAVLVSGIKDLKEVVKGMGEDDTILLTRPPYALGSYKDGFFYLASDFVISQVNNFVFLLPMDNSKFFSKNKLDSGLVYRVIKAMQGFVLDSIFDKDDPRIQGIKSLKVNDLSNPEVFSEFQKGYRIGFYNNLINNAVSNIYSSANLIGDPWSFGVIFGLYSRNQIRESIGSIGHFKELNKSSMVLLKLYGGQKIADKCLAHVNIHNLIQEGKSEQLAEAMGKCFTLENPGDDWDSMFVYFELLFRLSSNSHKLATIPVDSGWLETIYLPADNDSFKTTMELKHEKCQFRCLDYHSESATKIRVQMTNFDLRHFVHINEEGPFKLCQNKSEKTEWDLVIEKSQVSDFNKYKKLLEKLNYSQQSTAGTQMMYAPIHFDGTNFVSDETGDIIIPRDVFMAYIPKQFGVSLDFLNPNKAEEIQEVKVKKAKLKTPLSTSPFGPGQLKLKDEANEVEEKPNNQEGAEKSTSLLNDLPSVQYLNELLNKIKGNKYSEEDEFDDDEWYEDEDDVAFDENGDKVNLSEVQDAPPALLVEVFNKNSDVENK